MKYAAISEKKNALTLAPARRLCGISPTDVRETLRPLWGARGLMSAALAVLRWGGRPVRGYSRGRSARDSARRRGPRRASRNSHPAPRRRWCFRRRDPGRPQRPGPRLDQAGRAGTRRCIDARRHRAHW